MMQWLPEKPTLLKAQGVFWDHEPALSAGDRMQRTALSARHPWNWDLPVSCTFPNPDGIYLKDQGGGWALYFGRPPGRRVGSDFSGSGGVRKLRDFDRIWRASG